jgi:hypothetical protein
VEGKLKKQVQFEAEWMTFDPSLEGGDRYGLARALFQSKDVAERTAIRQCALNGSDYWVVTEVSC